jgi:hypothetical protein
MNFRIFVLALTTLSIAACANDNNDPVSKAANHIAEETGKQEANLQLRGQWQSACDSKGLLWAAAGIKSEMVVYDFYSNSGKTSQLFSDDNCQAQVGEAKYSGTATVGVPASVEGSYILDLNYTNVSIKISQQGVADALNAPLTPGCGVNDWVVNVGRDVTSAAGQANCPIAKPAQSFEIVKTDGRTMHLGLEDIVHDKSTAEKRPVALDMENGFSKK